MEPDELLEEIRARLPEDQRAAAEVAYQRSAKDGTAAFLTCYFLGLFGAHRMYLGDWGGAALRLLIPLGLALTATVGIVANAPRELVLALLALLLVVGLGWEGLDLLRIDREVAQRNLALAKSLLADAPRRAPAYRDEVGETLAEAEMPPLPAVQPPVAVQPPPPEWGVVSRPKGDTEPLPAVRPSQPPPSVPSIPSIPSMAQEESLAPATLPEPLAPPPDEPVASLPDEPVRPSQPMPVAPPVVPPVTPPVPAEAHQTPRPMKRVRVKRRIVVDGTVVGEQVIEGLVPADVDTQVAAAELRARLSHMTPEEIATLANLPAGAVIDLRDSARPVDQPSMG